MNSTKNEKMVKVVFAGESNVGKSSIVERFILNRVSNQTPTVGAAFAARKVTCGDKSVTLGIWDTAGQERFQAMSAMYFRQSLISILVFDLTNRHSFERIATWKQLSEDSNNENHGFPIYFLVGNKNDLPDRSIGKSEIDVFCEMNDINHYFETSAITGDGVKLLFDKITEEACNFKLPKNHGKLAIHSVSTDNNSCSC